MAGDEIGSRICDGDRDSKAFWANQAFRRYRERRMSRNQLDEVADQWVFDIAEFHNSHARRFREGRSWTQAPAAGNGGQRFASTPLFSSPRATQPN